MANTQPTSLGSMFGGTSPTPAASTAPATVSTTDPNSTNYLGMGMTKSAYEAMYGTGNQQGAAAASAAAGATAQGNNQVNNPAVNPNLPNSTVPGSAAATAAAAAAATPTSGTQSGPGVLDQWFNERASGTDPGYDYASQRGLTALGNQQAARGGYDSGAGLQQDSDFMANMGAQRESQLDSLATGASNENQNSLNSMFNQGDTLAAQQAGLGATYDTTGANAMSSANNTGLQYGAQAAMLPYLANQNLTNQVVGAATKLL
jgi:hypothetical protein